MSALRELYQQVIVDHSKQPRNFGALDAANHSKEGFNPLCGDRLTVYILEQAGSIAKIQFVGCGCAISVASASLMTEVLTGKSQAEVNEIFNDFHQLVTLGHDAVLEEKLGKLAVLAGVAEFPARVKCATLAWHTLKAALADDAHTVSTE
ncbi:MAG: SUF system NifU family Fe-S cluster assembly protein [Gammaproteobacteria bacterium]|nr:SUF system NifU family Fe-S cluster assembly protein [Gammaproteobacteria bacterium]